MYGDFVFLGDKVDDFVVWDWLVVVGNMVYQVVYFFYYYLVIVFGVILWCVGFLLQLFQCGCILFGGVRFIELCLQEVDYLVEMDIVIVDGGQQFIEFVEVIVWQQVFFCIFQVDV